MDKPSRTHVRLAGAEVSFLVAGPEEGEPVLLLHGIPAGAELWRTVLRGLASAGYRCYAPDLPGYGETRLPADADHSLAGAAALFGRWLHQERIGPAWVVGHDLGAGVAQIMAVREPDLLARLTLSNSPVEASWPVPIVRFHRLIARLHLYPLLARLGAPYVDPWFRYELRRSFAHPERLQEGDTRTRIFFDSKFTSPEGRRKFASHLVALENAQTVAVADGLREIHVPTLLLWGKRDEHQTWERVGRRLQQLIPEPEVVLLEDASHFAMLDQPDAFTDALLTWRGSRCPDPSAAADQGR
jgi:2-hydroxymuconate-semialdehyde hydrolase